jgi:hypothetical protein
LRVWTKEWFAVLPILTWRVPVTTQIETEGLTDCSYCTSLRMPLKLSLAAPAVLLYLEDKGLAKE